MEQTKIDIGYGIVAYINDKGQYHNLIGPAIIYPMDDDKKYGSHGREEYYVNGVLHREDGPAIFHPFSEQKMYYKKGKLHREDGPAIIGVHGTQEYYVNGVRHRDDGPAYISYDENGNIIEAYYINGNKVDSLKKEEEIV